MDGIMEDDAARPKRAERPGLFSPFEPLTPEQARWMVADLDAVAGSPVPGGEAGTLCRCLFDYLRLKSFDTALANLPAERQQIERALSGLRKAINELDNLGPIFSYELHTDEEGSTLNEALPHMRELEQELQYRLDELRHPRGRPRKEALAWAINDFAMVFEDVTGREPGVSSTYIASGSGETIAHGPFVRWCHKLLNLVDRIDPGPVRDMALKVLRARKNRTKARDLFNRIGSRPRV